MNDNGMRADEPARLAMLEAYAVMGSARDERFDRIAGLAARLFEVPIALVSFVGADHQWFKSALGLSLEGSPRENSFCTHVVQQQDLLVVADASQDPRFAASPLVAGPPGIRFFAGAPLTVEGGHTLGTLCVIDHRPRTLDAEQCALLTELSQLVVDQLELHKLAVLGRRGEAAIHGSETRLQRLLDQLLTHVAVLDLDGTLLEANEASLRAAGLTIDDVKGRPFWRCSWWSYSGTVGARVREAVRAAAGGTASRLDTAMRIGGGALVPIELMLAPLHDHDGHIVQIVASGIDVSERIALAEERRRLAAIVDEAPFLIRTATPQGRLLYVNRAGRDLLGYAPDADVRATQVRDHHPDWAMQRLTSEGYPTARKRGTWSGETAVFGGDGREIPISQFVIAHRAPEGEIEYFSSIGVDISASKAVEQSLKDSEARFRGTFENAAVGIAHIGTLGRWHRVNQRLLDILGYSRAELVQKTFQDVTHPADVVEELARFEALKAGKIDSYTMEKRLLRKNGGIVWMQATLSMQEVHGSSDPYAIAILEDISQRKASEHRQRLLLAELNHRVKNTLAIVQSIANQTLRQTADPKDFTESFFGRLQALSATHDLLSAQLWDGVDLGELLRSQITLNGVVCASRLDLRGAPLMLPPQTALNLSVVLHELATIALRVGAFSNETGRIEVGWETTQIDAAQWLHLQWRETGAPEVAGASLPAGWATLLQRSLVQGLGGQIALDWKPTGLEARLALPLPSARREPACFEA